MIEFIKGKIVYIDSEYLAVEREGIGYQVYAPNPSYFREEESVFLYTHFVVREDSHRLYGFLSKEERLLFRLLLEVSGIGPKVGLSIIASGSLAQIVSAVEQENSTLLTKFPGIGKKTAARIILELKGKLSQYDWKDSSCDDATSSQNTPSSHEQDVIDALITLGYSEEESISAARSVRAETVEESIKKALRIMMNQTK